MRQVLLFSEILLSRVGTEKFCILAWILYRNLSCNQKDRRLFDNFYIIVSKVGVATNEKKKKRKKESSSDSINY